MINFITNPLVLLCPIFPLVGYKGKAGPLQAWSGTEGSRKLRFPDFMTTTKDGGKVVCLMHRPPLPPMVIVSVRG